MSTLVMKFGGASVATPKHFSQIADIIMLRKLEYRRVAIVVSAMGDTTDQLIALAKEVNADPPKREYDMLLTVGERISISLLAMALALKNQDAVSFTGSQSGIITCSQHSDARIIDVRPHRLLPFLDAGKVVIVAGFQGVSRAGEITTLGRGGSDTTAAALGIALGAKKIEYYKDVAGIYDQDPKLFLSAKLLPTLSYDAALELVLNGSNVLHHRCLILAKKNNLPMHVRPFQNFNDSGTFIGESRQDSLMAPSYEENE